jgi:predicted deacetylase
VTREAVDAILADLAKVGIGRVSLLVVPDHHRRAPIAGDTAFSEWLRKMIAAGHEAVLHGYFHGRERKAHESASTQFMTRLYTADEGEFFDIGLDDARALMTRGREALTRCAAVAPAGFIAPAWLMSDAAEQAARELGFAYTTRLKTIVDLPARKTLRSQSLCWSVRSRWRRIASLGWNRYLYGHLRDNPLLRISIHPPDIRHPAVWRQIRALAAEAVKTQSAMTYSDFIDQWRKAR